MTTTLAGSVAVDGAGVATGTGMAFALYTAMIALPSFGNIDSAHYPGISTAQIVSAKRQLADTCNTFAIIADGPQWIVTPVKTTAYAAEAWDLVLCNPTAAGFTVTLPAPVSVPPGTSIQVKNVSASSNVITIATAGGANIDLAATTTLAFSLAGIQLTSDGATWWTTASR